MLDGYRRGPNSGPAGRERAEALRAVDDAVVDAETALVKAEEEAEALADAHTVLIVGEEGAGKSSLVNRILLHPLALSPTLARINAGAAATGANAEGVVETSTPWDADSSKAKLDASWFSAAAAARDAKLLRRAAILNKHTAVQVCPTGGRNTTTAMCTTIVLAPGLQPRLVLKYKSAAALCELRKHVDELEWCS
jgi:hypothetical protein